MSKSNWFHKSTLGGFGASLPCDLDGYVPMVGAQPEEGRWADSEPPWDWDEYLAGAIRATEECEAALDVWRQS